MASLEERYRAAMVLSGVGDALGYNHGKWESCNSGEIIHNELRQLGGLDKIVVAPPEWIVSDDTVMHLATAEALLDREANKGLGHLIMKLAAKYKDCLRDMKDRMPGMTTLVSCNILNPENREGCRVPFDPRAGGCGAAMRAMCIGLRYCYPNQLDDLIKVSVESGRLTHHHPTGYLGALTSALFTAYAIQQKPLRSWGAGLMDTLPKATAYIEDAGIDVKENLLTMGYFIEKWEDYLKTRHIKRGNSDPLFPIPYGVKERDAFYTTLSYGGVGGASGHDAPMIAYDAMLSCEGDWSQLCYRAMFHGGDSDSTGTIAACWYGALYGFLGVPKPNYEQLEYRNRLEIVAKKLYSLRE